MPGDNTDDVPVILDQKVKWMLKKKFAQPDDIDAMIKALKRARKLARKVSFETGTPFIHVKNGKIIKEMITKP